MPSPPEDQETPLKLPDVLPILPLEDTVVFPYIIVPLSVDTEKGIHAIDHALSDHRLVLLVGQKQSNGEEPAPDQLHSIGSVGMIMRMLKLPDGRIRILVQGLARAEIEKVNQTEPFLQARIRALASAEEETLDIEAEALVRSVRENLEKALHMGKNISPEVMVVAANLEDAGRLADLAASNLELRTDDAQTILETLPPMQRLAMVNDHLHREIDLLRMQHEISNQAQEEIERSQREYFLRQQLKAIQDELGEGDDFAEDIATYRRLAAENDLPDEAREEMDRQIRRLERSHPDSAENNVVRTYLDWLTSLPWSRNSEDQLDLDHAQQVLDEDHFDLAKVKERILEFLAVRQLKADTKGPILCFVGPPGVGKTSLGRSIARALGRQFVRISLGGVRDEAEIRGHRRTYVGALPGRIIQSLHRAGTSNPVFMLDEIDKIGSDYRGDPSSALLEVLDPEQNGSFRDHYLSVPYDLSRVIFITTANLLDPIQPAFLDRMEVIPLSGYSEEEKLQIARRHLIPKQLDENGIGSEILRFSEPGVRKIIRGHTRESGLRNLEREIGAICRKVATRIARGNRSPLLITARKVEKLLGTDKHFFEALLDRDRIGVATGLAWTAQGGDLLFIEAIAVPGEGKLSLTGRLGEVMKESAQAAVSFARTFSLATYGSDEFFTSHDFHIHAPAGSISKDGPSAGITIATALLSMLTRTPVSRTVAMTGEITLRGEILPIGGVKEKVLAARAAGIEQLILPKTNRKDLEDLPRAVRASMNYHFLAHMDEVLPIALPGWKKP